MFNLKNLKKTTQTPLEEEINDLLAQMKTMKAKTSEDYQQLADRLNILYKLKEVDSKKRVSADTVAVCLTNVAGILLITHWEQSAKLITSKASSMILRAVK